MAEYVTKFAGLEDFQKGSLEIIDDDPKSYTYSNMFEVASNAKPWEQIAVAKNMEYVLATVRAEGTSGWRICSHDEFAIVMDGEVEFRFLKPDDSSIVPGDDKEGSVALDGDRAGATGTHDLVAGGGRLPDAGRPAGRPAHPGHRGRGHAVPLGRDLPDDRVDTTTRTRGGGGRRWRSRPHRMCG